MRTLDFLGLDESRLQGVTDGLAQLFGSVVVKLLKLGMHSKETMSFNIPVEVAEIGVIYLQVG